MHQCDEFEAPNNLTTRAYQVHENSSNWIFGKK